MQDRDFRYRLRQFSVFVIPVLFIAWAIHYISQHPGEFYKVFSLTFPVLLLLGLSQLLSVWVTSLLTLVMAKPFGVTLRFHEYFGITVIARTLNLLLPMKGGAGARALYLRTQHDLPITDFAAMFAGQSLLALFVAAALSLTGSCWLFVETGVYDIIGLMFFAGVAVVSGILVFFSPELGAGDSRVWNLAKRVLDGWHSIRGDRVIVLKICVISLVNVLLSAFSIGLTFWALQNPQSAGTALYLGGSQDIMYLASFTPGALGVVEGSTVFLSNNLSIDISDALLVALIIRTVILLVSGLMTPWYLYRLLGPETRQLFAAGGR